jgi:hypothetical protein
MTDEGVRVQEKCDAVLTLFLPCVYYLNAYIREIEAMPRMTMADHVQLSQRDGLRVLDLLENPPAPNARLLAAAQALQKRR